MGEVWLTRAAGNTATLATCPACGTQERDDRPHAARFITDRYGKAWGLVACAACGVQFQRDPMTDDQRREFYGSGEYRRLCEQATGQPWTDERFLRQQQIEYAWKFSRVTRALPAGVWLDFGGSTGVVSSAWNPILGRALETYRLAEVIVADYGDGAPYTPEHAWDLGPYDAILCCQTLDHLREPLVTLRKFREVAKDGARLFVDVVKKAHTEYKIDHDTYYPTASSFTSLVERAGWQIVWLDGDTNPTHYSILAEKA